jgi:acyl carrier protein
MTTLETLQDILMREYQLSREQLAPEAPMSALGIDSLGMIELMFQIEERFGLTLPDDDATQFTTVADVVRFIDQLRQAPVPSASATVPGVS